MNSINIRIRLIAIGRALLLCLPLLVEQTQAQTTSTYDGIYQWSPGKFLSLHQDGTNMIATIYFTGDGNFTFGAPAGGGTLPVPQLDLFDLMSGTVSGSSAHIDGTRFHRACNVAYDFKFNSDTSITVTRVGASNTSAANSAGISCSSILGMEASTMTVPKIRFNPAPVSASAEGFWVGSTANGHTVNLAILENGETWGLYGSGNTVAGAVYGVTTTSGTTLSGSGIGFNFVTRTVESGTFSGSVTTKGAINLNVSDGTRFSGNYDASYDQSTSLASLAGTYYGWGVTGTISPQTTQVTVSANGNIYSSFVSGNYYCVTSGNATPRASGKNVFNVQVSFSGNYCALGNGTVVTGVATYTAANRQLIMMGMNSAKSDGLIYIGTR